MHTHVYLCVLFQWDKAEAGILAFEGTGEEEGAKGLRSS